MIAQHPIFRRLTRLLALLSCGALQPALADTLVVGNKGEATASLIDLASGDVVATLPTGDYPHEVGISPDGRFALVTNYGTRAARGNSLTLIDIPAAEVVRTISLGDYRAPHGVVWIDDSRAVVTVEQNRAVIVVDVVDGEVDDVIESDQATTHMIAVAPDGKLAFTANIGSGSVTVVDLEKGERVTNVATDEGAEGVAVTASGKHVWVSNRAADTITILDADNFETVAEFGSPGFPIRATATPAGQVLVTRARAGDMVIYDAASFDVVRIVAFDLGSLDTEGRLFGDQFGDSSVPIGVVVNGDGSLAYVAHANADVITEVDLETGAVTRTLRAGREPDGMGDVPLRQKMVAALEMTRRYDARLI